MYQTACCGYCKCLKSQLAYLGVTFPENSIEEVAARAEIVEKVNSVNCTVLTLVFSSGSTVTNRSAKEEVKKIASI